ncbi:helix-turn-helix transcriptional regulator [Saccharothrix sp.]|uniref:helix-turn-helix domain-containing protein n=1 Tax=Saccharothrix sp. TaxID=1873460 RepID=UPI002812215F|nr:helix-turn-helix transcriptional regulator [Saccharothrix sp.]
MSTQPPFRRRRLGRKLARMRADARLTLDGAATALFKTKSALHRIEKGETLVDPHLVKSMMDLYDHYDPDIVLEALRARERGWWTALGVEDQGYIDVESEAAEVRDVSLLLIPGLLQTADYTRALCAARPFAGTKEQDEQNVRARQVRQRRLTDPDHLLRLEAIVDEAALRKGPGGREVMRAQLEHLLEVAELPNVSFRVLAHECGAHGAMGGGFALLNFPDPADPPVLYVEHPFGAVHMEDEGLTIEARLAFEHLTTQALGLDESVALVQRILAE